MTPLFRKRRRAQQSRNQLPAAGTMPSANASGTRAIAIAAPGGFFGIAQTGDNARAVALPPEALRPPAEVGAPPGLDNLPYHGVFVGRTAELDRLDMALAVPGEVVVQAVHGLGGIGKSSLAAHWAATRARTQGCAPIRWITADNASTVQQGLADLATALQPALAQALPVEELAELALQWLATHTGWLLILDNVNDPKDIAPLLARATSGRFLITSRLAAAWHTAATVIRLDVLEEAEALALLTRIATAAVGPRDLDGAAELCTQLGHLPLAVEQAAAYLAQSPLLTPRGYLALLAQYPADMYKAGGAGVTDTERTIARIWRLTLDRIHQTLPLATDLLRTLAWYAPDHIPATFLSDAADPPVVTSALGLLTAYSMASADPSTGTLAVHRLVQALARTFDPNDPHRTPDLIEQARNDATAHLRDALPATWQDPGTWSTWRALLPHIDALTDRSSPETDTADTALILNEAGLFLNLQGSTGRAITHFERGLAAGVRILGEDHPQTLTVRNNLARAYEFSGDVARAVPLLEQTLRDRARIHGEDDPLTLSSRNNLAMAYQSAGDLSRAIPLYEQTLRDRVRIHGQNHPDTLIARNNLAFAYRSAGDLARAIPLHEHNLDDAVRILGKDHLHTLVLQNNLAGGYEALGDLARAIPLYERTLRDRVRVLGEDHPHTLATRNALADSYGAAGDLGRAVPLYERTLRDRVRVLGEDHPHTLATRNDLAGAYRSAGDLGRAIALYEQTLAAVVRVLGEDHPLTQSVRHARDSALAKRAVDGPKRM
ncbi:tetratricopeptide (TPR) repeat protein [Streptomyces sp. V4I23]|uniref:tetratricopeptide repeat protein n=1 Tax=Streptomyces sp. V4I23 TaxID=3042282 RepID=UPI00278266C9|nr:tetratricopeptide repeat protein [Streptomyces sp. V4I23]MDQ1006904.1 tetratricopeptide (TPR) repeat protein [Streptomyces sp. V4I23]